MFDDLYPVAVTVDGHRWGKARLFHRDGQVRLYVDGRPPRLVAEGTVEDSSRLRGRNVTLTVDGATWEVVRGSGCGCGSALKRMTSTEAFA